MSTLVPSRRELLAWALAIVLAVTAVVATRSDHAGAGVAGPTTEVVYIATGANFPDALAAAATAAMGLGPVLLVEADAVPEATLEELGRLQPSRIVISGGLAVVSAGVEAELQALAWSPEVQRIAGDNRYETAAALSADLFPTSGIYARAAYAYFDEQELEEKNVEPVEGTTELLSVDIEAPAPGILIINASADYDTNFDSGCHIRIDNEQVRGSYRHNAASGSIVCATDVGIAVDAGMYTVSFFGEFHDGSNPEWSEYRTLTVLWTPFDGFGARITP